MKYEDQLLRQLPSDIVEHVEREYRFAAEHIGLGPGLRARLKAAGFKDWRFDLAWLYECVAVEIEGGGWSGGRHVRGAGFHGDLLKYSAAMELGWSVYRCDGQMIKDGTAARVVANLL